MRAIRVLSAALLVVAGAAVAGAGTAAAEPVTYTAVTGNSDPLAGTGTLFAADTGVTAPVANTSGITFDVASPQLTVQIAPPTGQVLAVTQYTTAASATETSAQLAFSTTNGGCSNATGTLDVTQLETSGADVTAFAAQYTFDCAGTETSSGDLRFNSSSPYPAVMRTPSSWDFGTQRVGYDGWTKTFTFTNEGSVAQGFTSATTGSSVFQIKANTCHTLAPQATCTVTVAPHPASTGAAATATLRLVPSTPDEVPAHEIALRVLGQLSTSFYADAGPERVALTWFQLPAPFGALGSQTALFRGTSASRSAMTLLRNVYGASYVDNVAANRTYYYALRPRLADGSLGDWSPVIAARPWPKYSAGMYHRLSAPVRIVASHRVSAGHPFVLKVLGAHGVPASHVSAIALNVTAASSTATTKVYAYPYGSARPAAADLAVRARDTRSNFVLARVGKLGRIVIATAHGSVPVSVDVFGYFSAAGLSSTYGMGGAPHVYGYSGTLVDTQAWHWGALKHDYYVDAVADYFSPEITPHVSSLIVEVTAYGSKGGGTINGFTTNGRPGKTSVLSYRPGVTTSSVAILRAGRWYDPTTGNAYPSVSLLNAGAKPVQLVVTVLGFVDDNTLPFGQRYVPTSPVHLLGATLHAGTNRTIYPGSHAGYWTSGFNTKLAATQPSRTTTVSLHGIGLGAAPSHGQLHAPARVDTVSSTLATVGTANRIGVHNSAGTLRLDVWSFGRFDYYPVPITTASYASVTAPPRESAGALTPATPRVYRAS